MSRVTRTESLTNQRRGHGWQCLGQIQSADMLFGLHGVINIFEPVYTNQKISHRKLVFLASLENQKLWQSWTHIPIDHDSVGLSDGCLFG